MEKSTLLEGILLDIKEITKLDNLEQVDYDADIMKELGVNSGGFIQIILKIEKRFDIEIDDDVLFSDKISSINKILKYIEGGV